MSATPPLIQYAFVSLEVPPPAPPSYACEGPYSTAARFKTGMATASHQTPDLASVLHTLAQYTPVADNPTSPSTPESGVIDDGVDYEPPEATVPDLQPRSEQNSSGPQSHPVSKQPPAATQSRAKVSVSVDPAKITDWPNGLRHVMRTVARNDGNIARIKKVCRMINHSWTLFDRTIS